MGTLEREQTGRKNERGVCEREKMLNGKESEQRQRDRGTGVQPLHVLAFLSASNCSDQIAASAYIQGQCEDDSL